jgi:hypothetical protein
METKMAIVTAYQIRATWDGRSGLGERYYSDRADAEAGAACLNRRAPIDYEGPRVPEYSVEAVRASHHCVVDGARFVSNRRAA